MDENHELGPGMRDVTPPPRQAKSRFSKAINLLMILGIVGLAICLLLPTQRTAREAARRNTCVNHLKQIALALQSYANDYHALPPAFTIGSDGKPMHTWRTLILPYIEERRLYETIDLTKPWNDPANAKALNTTVDLYKCPSNSGPANYTTYLAVVGPNSCLHPTQPRKLSEITDAASQTLILVEADPQHAVPWMSPTDADEQLVLDLGPQSQLAHVYGFNAAFVDGHVVFLDAALSASQRRALMSIAGNDEVEPEEAD